MEEHLEGPLGPWPCIGRGELVQRAVRTLTRTDPRTVLFKGSLGVGKSRVVDEVVLALESSNVPVRRVAATSATQMVPFGAVAHLLPADLVDRDDPRVVIAAVRDALALDQERAVLVVDDVPLLDAATSTVLANLVVTGAVTLLASVRADGPIPDSLVSALPGDKVDIVEVEPLTEMGLETLLHLALGAPVDGAAMLALSQRSAGNPLFVRELTRVAIETGALALSAGVWRLNRDLPRAPRLKELVEAGLDSVDGDARRVLDLLGLCEPVDLDELESFSTIEDLVSLEERGLLRVEDRSGSFVAWLGHPLHGEAIRIGLTPLRTRMVLRDHIDWVEAHADLSSMERLRCGLWRLDAGLRADNASLLEGAALARVAGDPTACARLARAAFHDQPTVDAGFLLFEALFSTGQWDEASDVFDEIEQLDVPAAYKGALAATKASTVFWADEDLPAALVIGAEALADPEIDQPSRALVASSLAWLLLNSGAAGDSLSMLLEGATIDLDAFAEDDLAVSRSPELARPYAMLLALSGRTRLADKIVDHGTLKGVDGNLDDIDKVHWLSARTFIALERGDLAAAIEAARAGYESTALSRSVFSELFFAVVLGRAYLLAGQPKTAAVWFVRARALGLDTQRTRLAWPGVIGLAMATALLPDEPGVTAEEIYDIETPDGLYPFAFLVPSAAATGWMQVRAGQLTEARTTFLDGARSMSDAGNLTAGVWLLHDAARVGAASEAAALLDDLTIEVDSDLVVARAVHIRALASRDVAGLVDAAGRFEQLGMLLFAAEALVMAGDLSRSAGKQRDASGFSVWANRLLEKCEGAVTPTLATNASTIVPLTERERDVAYLAAQGMASKEIGESLFLSRRTVDNHLSHVYEKLGIRNRSQLPEALGIGVSGNGVVSKSGGGASTCGSGSKAGASSSNAGAASTSSAAGKGEGR